MENGLRRIFILYRSPLFGMGLSALLSQVPGLTVVGLSCEIDAQQTAWEEILKAAPDVIILEQEEVNPLDRALDVEPRAQLISISLQHTNIRLYERHEFPGKGLEGVVEAIAQTKGEQSGAARKRKAGGKEGAEAKLGKA